jgi:hypothetical protein
MTTAVYAPALAGEAAPSKLSQAAKRFMHALMESRARSAARMLRQHQAFIEDLGRRQDHSADFLIQDNALPFRL